MEKFWWRRLHNKRRKHRRNLFLQPSLEMSRNSVVGTYSSRAIKLYHRGGNTYLHKLCISYITVYTHTLPYIHIHYRIYPYIIVYNHIFPCITNGMPLSINQCLFHYIFTMNSVKSKRKKREKEKWEISDEETLRKLRAYTKRSPRWYI